MSFYVNGIIAGFAAKEAVPLSIPGTLQLYACPLMAARGIFPLLRTKTHPTHNIKININNLEKDDVENVNVYCMTMTEEKNGGLPTNGKFCDGRDSDVRDIDRWENDGGRIHGIRRVLACG